MVFNRRYRSCGPLLSTKPKTLDKKKSGFPIETFPNEIDAAILTSS
jgi:hypothetical protein